MHAHSDARTARRISQALLTLVALLAMVAATSMAPADAAAARKKHKPPFAVSLSVSRSSIAAGGSVGLSGHVGPTKKAKKRTIAVQRRIGAGGWVTIAHKKLSKKARYAVTVRLSTAGSYAFRVFMPKSKKRSAGVSAAHTVQVAPPAWRSVSSGGNHTCGLRVDGSLWCWGSNQFGQLGSATNVGTTTAVTRPVRVGASTSWVAVKAGNGLTCGVMRNHTAWCWGQNSLGQLGNATNSGTSTPNRTPLAVAGGAVWASVVTSTTGRATCGIRTDHSLYCWGSDSNGQLGNGAADTNPHPTPARVGSDSNWRSIAAGATHTCGTRVDGSLWCWGSNNYGQQGNGTAGVTNTLTATRVGTSFAWTSVVSGYDTSCATQSDRSVWCWGYNGTGPAGGTTSPRTTPGTVAGIPANVAQLTVGGDHSCVVTSSGAVSCWGENYYGELGTSTNFNTFTANPTPLPGPTGPWSSVSNGGFHTCAVRAGTAWCWGSNGNGQLGTATALGAKTATPQRVGS